MDVSEYLENLPAQVPVGVNLTTSSKNQLKINGVAGVLEPPALEIRFPENTLPKAERIDPEADCLIFIETGEIVTLTSSLKDFPGKDRLRVMVREVVQHMDKRDYYRGPAERVDISWSRKSRHAQKDQEWFQARGVNISCGGILFNTNQPITPKERLLIEIDLPGPVHKKIICQASVIRVNTVKKDAYFAALQFHNLDPEHCDNIMSFCFAEQRRILREQVITNSQARAWRKSTMFWNNSHSFNSAGTDWPRTTCSSCPCPSPFWNKDTYWPKKKTSKGMSPESKDQNGG